MMVAHAFDSDCVTAVVMVAGAKVDLHPFTLTMLDVACRSARVKGDRLYSGLRPWLTPETGQQLSL